MCAKRTDKQKKSCVVSKTNSMEFCRKRVRIRFRGYHPDLRLGDRFCEEHVGKVRCALKCRTLCTGKHTVKCAMISEECVEVCSPEHWGVVKNLFGVCKTRADKLTRSSDTSTNTTPPPRPDGSLYTHASCQPTSAPLSSLRVVPCLIHALTLRSGRGCLPQSQIRKTQHSATQTRATAFLAGYSRTNPRESILNVRCSLLMTKRNT